MSRQSGRLTYHPPVKPDGVQFDGNRMPYEDLERTYWNARWGSFRPKIIRERAYYAAIVEADGWIALQFDIGLSGGDRGSTWLKISGEYSDDEATLKRLSAELRYLTFTTTQEVTLATPGVCYLGGKQLWIPISSFLLDGWTCFGLCPVNADSYSAWNVYACKGSTLRRYRCVVNESTTMSSDPSWQGCHLVHPCQYGTLGQGAPPAQLPPSLPPPASTGTSDWTKPGLRDIIGEPPRCTTTCTFEIIKVTGTALRFHGRGVCTGFGSARSVRHLHIEFSLDTPRMLNLSWGTKYSLQNTVVAPLDCNLPMKWISIPTAIHFLLPDKALIAKSWGSC